MQDSVINEVVTYTYNNRMLPTSVVGTDTYAQSIAYDSANRMIEIIRGANKIHTDYTYNAWNVDGGRLLNITSTQVSTSSSLQNLTYDYDPVGNINTIVDALSGPQTQSFTYDALDRVLTSSATGGSNGLYSEGYEYYEDTGNLKKKNNISYTYNSGHAHGVSSLGNGNTYGYDANGNMTSRNVNGQSFTLIYDAENRLVAVSGAATASFFYDGDGKQIKATVNGVTTVYVGNHYEVKSGVATKYYFAGATRLAMRMGETLSFLLGDHLGSSSVTTNANGGLDASALYKAFGETRYTYGSLGTDYKFTGQREEVSLGIYWFQSRWFDAGLGRFTQPDSTVPTQTQGTQAWDRYAFVNNNPVRYNDPTGHMIDQGDGGGATCGGYGQPLCSTSGDGGGAGGGDEDDDHHGCLDDLWKCYKQGWMNTGSAWTTITTPDTPAIAEVYAIVYLIGWLGANTGLVVGLAGLGCAALSAACVAAVEGALGIGGGASADGDPTNEYQALLQMAKELYPKLAGKADQLHHIFPKYLGGDPNGFRVPLNPAYHQLITNAFRSAWAYGKGAPSLFEAQQIMLQVYSEYPLPPSP